MASKFLGKGWTFPVKLDGHGRIAMSEHEQDIRESILILLSTSKGERVMRPDYGCGIEDFVFTTIDVSTLTLIETQVKEALKVWEPRIEVTNVAVSTEDIHEGKLMVRIEYRVRTTNNQFNLVYPFYLTEGE